MTNNESNPQNNYDALTNVTEQKTTAFAGSYLGGIFSHDKTDWETPQDLYDALNKGFQFSTDVCAVADNAKCEHYYSPEENGLAQEWEGTCWMNPPYGRQIGIWLKKAQQSSQNGATIVCLIPARTDTKWFQDIVSRAAHIEFLKGRLKFGDSKNSAPFPSALVVFAPQDAELPMLKQPGAGHSILGGNYQGRSWVVTHS